MFFFIFFELLLTSSSFSFFISSSFTSLLCVCVCRFALHFLHSSFYFLLLSLLKFGRPFCRKTKKTTNKQTSKQLKQETRSTIRSASVVHQRAIAPSVSHTNKLPELVSLFISVFSSRLLFSSFSFFAFLSIFQSSVPAFVTSTLSTLSTNQPTSQTKNTHRNRINNTLISRIYFNDSNKTQKLIKYLVQFFLMK